VFGNEKMSEKPNSVLFRLDDGKFVLAQIKNRKWDWDMLIHFKDPEGKFEKDWSDISIMNPFEFVFCYWDGTNLTSSKKKTIVKNESFLSLMKKHLIFKLIETDYNILYGDLTKVAIQL
jgi:hypothetical protein